MSTASPAISVIIPARDMARFLPATLDSLRAQSQSAFEAIIVDDGSADATRRIAEEAAAADPRLRVMAGPCLGVSAARNAGAARARAAALLFLDADDLLAPHALDRLLRDLETAPGAVAVLGGVRRVDVAGRPLPGSDNRDLVPRDPETRLRALLRKNYVVNGGNLALRRAAFEAVGGFAPALANGEDWALWCELAAIGRIALSPGPPVLAYRQVPGGANARPRRAFERVASIEHVARSKAVQRAVGAELPRLLRTRRMDHFWSGVRNDLLHGARWRAARTALIGVIAYPDSLAQPALIRRFLKTLVVRS